jgi:D-aspartate ligase
MIQRSSITTTPSRRARSGSLHLDRDVPTLLFKVGRYPVHHGGLGVVRTLGRLGVDVHAVTEDHFTPAARSRYLGKAITWRTTGAESAEQLIDGLLKIATRMTTPAVLLVTDEEAAVLIAEHADELRPQFLLPDVPADLPRQLASKWGLAQICWQHGVPAARCVRPESLSDLMAAANTIGFPLALKNDLPWIRLTQPAVSSTTIIRNETELDRVTTAWPTMPSVLVQEYLPQQHSEDWIVHVYAGRDPQCMLVFTAIKTRSWPAFAGATAIAYSAPNPELAAAAQHLCQSIGYRGIADMDWRLDLRDGSYKLLDFNPRVGMNFRLFETEDGIDVVRAMHLDLTGRRVPISPQIDNRRFVAEQFAAAAALAYWRAPGTKPKSKPPKAAEVEYAWLAADDPVPAVLAAARLAHPAAFTLRGMLKRRGRPR